MAQWNFFRRGSSAKRGGRVVRRSSGICKRRPLNFECLEPRQLLSVDGVVKLGQLHAGAIAAGLAGNDFMRGLHDSLATTFAEIASNPDERPQMSGQMIGEGGTQYQLTLDPNGMPVSRWSIDWGDGTTPADRRRW